MRREAADNEAADKAKRDSTEARNHAESTVWEIEKNLDTYKDQLTDADRENIRAKIADVRSAIDSNDSENIKTTSTSLQVRLPSVSLIR